MTIETIDFKTTLGTIKGIKEGGKLFFKGLPYAYTPRFQSPLINTNLDGFDGTVTEKDALQRGAFVKEKDFNAFYGKEFGSDKEYDYTEDYVCLNITTKASKEKMPVLIFIHGGGFESGCINDLPYGESEEYLKRDVILISMTYRMNIFGFFRNHNYGLEDMICGIEWIHKYIDQFNGDPNRITLIGQSAGAMSITDLLYTQTLKGKVAGAIMMSGCGATPTIAGPYTYEQSKPYWDGFLKEMNLNSDEGLLKLDSETLWMGWRKYTSAHYGFHTSQPGIDGTIIYDLPAKMMKEDRILDIPLIVGVTSQDFLGPLAYLMALNYAKHFLKHKHSKVYPYFFDRTLPGNSYKSFHSCDLWYMFGNMEHSWRPFEPLDYQMKDRMIDYVTSFVKTGNPNNEELPCWAQFDFRCRFKVFKDNRQRTIAPFAAVLKTLYYFLFDKGPM